MSHPETETTSHDGCEPLLAAYRSEQTVRRRIDPKHDGWVSRVKTVNGVPDDELPEIHGRLIAHGLLKFQLAGRNEGVVYQLSAAGKDSLAREVVPED